MLSPYQFNPLGFDPLRKVLEAEIGFEHLRKAAPVELLIAATDMATGRARLFRRHELCVEAVLASACLPTLHHAVEIEGRAYWDGGFSANPDLVTLASESPVGDTLLVQLNPVELRTDPKSAREIAGHISHITFNQPLMRDVAMILAARESATGWLGLRRGRLGRLARHRFHLIEAVRYTAPLGFESKLKPDGELVGYLFAAGRTEAQKWLERHWPSVGRTETADLAGIVQDQRGTSPAGSAGRAAPSAKTGSESLPTGREGVRARA
jgi:NTE family protein